MSARGFRNPETSAEPDGVRAGGRMECHETVIPILNTIHSYLLHNLYHEKMVLGKLMILPLSILVSRKLNLCDFPGLFLDFHITIYSNKKYTYCFKVFGISASTRNVSNFFVQIPLTANLDISLISPSVTWSFHFAVVTIASLPHSGSP